MEHTHSNRYIYITSENNNTFNSVKEFLVDQGFDATAKDVIDSRRFYSNLVGPDGRLLSQEIINYLSHNWHSGLSYEFKFKNPDTGKEVIVRRLKKFRGEELND